MRHIKVPINLGMYVCTYFQVPWHVWLLALFGPYIYVVLLAPGVDRVLLTTKLGDWKPVHASPTPVTRRVDEAHEVEPQGRSRGPDSRGLPGPLLFPLFSEIARTTPRDGGQQNLHSCG